MRAALLKRELGDLALVAAGAVPGSLLRWRLALWWPESQGAAMAWLDGTLLANLLGCLLIGVLVAQPPRRARLFLWGGIGVSGSLTTFSTWMLDLSDLLSRADSVGFLFTLLIPLFGGLALMALGHDLGRRLSARSD
ncbi:MAG: fluoride efflux transporter FluC [Cyanobium sp.]